MRFPPTVSMRETAPHLTFANTETELNTLSSFELLLKAAFAQ